MLLIPCFERFTAGIQGSHRHKSKIIIAVVIRKDNSTDVKPFDQFKRCDSVDSYFPLRPNFTSGNLKWAFSQF